MGIFEGKRVASCRKRMLAFCARNGIKVPDAFHDIDPVLKIAVIDLSIPKRPLLLAKTFYSGKTVMAYFKENNKYPGNYRVLDFKRGVELVFDMPSQPSLGAAFDNCKDADTVY